MGRPGDHGLDVVAVGVVAGPLVPGLGLRHAFGVPHHVRVGFVSRAGGGGPACVGGVGGRRGIAARRSHARHHVVVVGIVRSPFVARRRLELAVGVPHHVRIGVVGCAGNDGRHVHAVLVARGPAVSRRRLQHAFGVPHHVRIFRVGCARGGRGADRRVDIRVARAPQFVAPQAREHAERSILAELVEIGLEVAPVRAVLDGAPELYLNHLAAGRGHVFLVFLRLAGPGGERHRRQRQREIDRITAERAVGERRLPAVCRIDHRIAHAAEELANLEAGRGDVLEQRPRIGAVPARAVVGGRVGRGGVGDQGVGRRVLEAREAAAYHKGACRPEAALHLFGEGIVAAGVEDHEAELRGPARLVDQP